VCRALWVSARLLSPRPPEHKGKVEQGGVHDVKRNFLGGRSHGTTKEAPLDRFEAMERAQLKPLPVMPYDLAVWKQVKLHCDCDVVFE
jgi:hypothetical protein